VAEDIDGVALKDNGRIESGQAFSNHKHAKPSCSILRALLSRGRSDGPDGVVQINRFRLSRKPSINSDSEINTEMGGEHFEIHRFDSMR
jgi:hypothetical protein